MNYATLIPYTFKRFSILSALRTAVPTAQYYLTKPVLPPGTKPALFTMNILPPAMTVWYHCARKALGDTVDIVIFDSSGKLRPQEFPGAMVWKFLNVYAATKSQEFLESIARNRDIGWICDDDIFLTSPGALDLVQKELADPATASVSFRGRRWWHFEIDGKQYWPSSSYCTAFNRRIFIDREHLSLAPAPGNTHPSTTGKGTRRYDTGDKANEILLRKGYRCAIVDPEEEGKYIAGFGGMSGGVMMLNYFSKKEQMLDYLLSPPKEQWSGNVLYGMLCALTAIATIQECYTRIKGRPYPLPALLSFDELMKIRRDHEQYLRSDQSYRWVDEARERLIKAI